MEIKHGRTVFVLTQREDVTDKMRDDIQRRGFDGTMWFGWSKRGTPALFYRTLDGQFDRVW